MGTVSYVYIGGKPKKRKPKKPKVVLECKPQRTGRGLGPRDGSGPLGNTPACPLNRGRRR
jgi:hypothetical protein